MDTKSNNTSPKTSLKKENINLNTTKIIKGNRRLVREKILQILFAHFISNIPVEPLTNHIFYRVFPNYDDENQNNNTLNDNDTIRLLNDEELSNISADNIIQWRDDDIKFANNIITTVINNYDIFSEYIKDASINWNFNRITIIDRTAIMIAIAEFVFFPNIPVNVSINEALELVKNYSTDKSTIFVNGVLEKILHNENKKA